MSKRLPAMEGYQPVIKLPKNLETKGYQPQQTISTSTNPPKPSPPKKP